MMATTDTSTVNTQVLALRATAKGGKLALPTGKYRIDSGSIYLAPGWVLIACDPPGVCTIEVPAGKVATWNVVPQKEWDDAAVSRGVEAIV